VGQGRDLGVALGDHRREEVALVGDIERHDICIL
jgi:hypothetical protein